MLPHLLYCLIIWGFKSKRIFKLQKKVIRIISLKKMRVHSDPLFKNLKIMKIHDLYKLKLLKFYYKYLNNLLPSYFNNFLQTNLPTYNLRNPRILYSIRARSELHKGCARYRLAELVNSTTHQILSKAMTHSLQSFSSFIKVKYIDLYPANCYDVNCYVCRAN